MAGDIISEILKKALSGREVTEFIPEIVPRDVKTPEELIKGAGKNLSLESAVREVLPVNVFATIGDVQQDVVDMVDSVLPENLIGAGGDIDLPEPKMPTKYSPRRTNTKGVTARGIGSKLELPKLPKAPWD